VAIYENIGVFDGFESKSEKIYGMKFKFGKIYGMSY
jgi:hypothetical protein